MDRIPPEVVDHSPQSDLTGVSLTEEISITFSEAMDKTSVVDALFLAPAPKEPVEIKWQGRKMKVLLAEKLQRDKTYVVTLGVSCRDLHNNSLLKSYSFAFSTGDKIDLGTIQGQVYHGISPRKGIDIWAYQLDGAFQPDPAAHPPDYITQTDGHGHFRLEHLGQGQYRLFAVEDLNDDRRFNVETEPLAVPSGDVLVTEAKISVQAWPFRLARLDTTGPSLTAADAPDRGKVILHFDEPVDSMVAASKGCYRLYAPEEESAPLEVRSVSLQCESQNRVILSTGPQVEGRRYRIFLSEMRDLAGNQISSPGDQGEFLGSGQRDLTGPMLVELWPPDSAEDISQDAVVSICFDEAVEPVSVETSFVLSDFMHEALTGYIHWDHGAKMTFFPDRRLVSGELHSIFVNAAGVRDLAGNPMADTVLGTAFRTIEAEQLGSLSGKINRQGFPDTGTVFLRAHGLDQAGHASLAMTQEGEYRFAELLPGRYLISAFLDVDQNGRFSYGRPIPFIPAEPFWVSQDTVMVRSRWETAGVDIVWER